jgi:DNA-binding XRE family transcriptional regulator
MSNTERPFRTLGWHLKLAREQLKETMAEVSGAVEIEPDALELIEQGRQRPSEEILLLLISHFGLEDVEATSLWELAGYTDIGSSKPHQSEIAATDRSVTMSMPADLRVVYTDLVHVMVNDYGVVMNFMQGTAPGSQPMAVSRVGMSKEHARSVLEVLQQTLEQADKPRQAKLLPRPKNKKRPDTSR